MSAPIRRKQRTTQDDWTATLAAIESIVPEHRLEMLARRTVVAIKQMTGGKRAAFGWSGGKDSQVLEHLCYEAGVRECVLGMSDLEYPAFLRWVTDFMPRELEVICTGQDLDWLRAHPTMLFPQDAKTAGQWFKGVQHTAQAQYFTQRRLDVLILGRRKADGNHVGAGNIYTNAKGITRYSPLADWTHEETLAFIKYRGIGLAPFYSWPNGYRCGTHSWAARQWTGGEAQGWREVASIDPSIVRLAAPFFPLAAATLKGIV